MKLICFATFAEAEATITALDAKQEDNGLFIFSEGRIVISGMGILAAQAAVLQWGKESDFIWNLGCAGALDPRMPAFSIHTISSVGKWIPYLDSIDNGSKTLAQKTFPVLHTGKQGARLITSDIPIHDISHRNPLAKEWDLVDMEGYGIAHAAFLLEKAYMMTKIVSDFASQGGRDLILRHMKMLSHQLAEEIVRGVKLCPHQRT